MANEKIFQSRIQLKHDIEENWSKATNFIPKVGEIIIYDIDENNSIARFKIGDGITNINSLPFVSHHEVISYLPQELTEEQKKQARDNIGSGDPQIQTDWNQNDETAVDFIKNRTHYEIPDVWEKVEFTEPLIKDVSTTMFVSEEYTWSADKTYRVRVDGVEYVFDRMTNEGLMNAFGGKEVYSIGATYVALNSNIDWTEYPFSFATADFTNIYAVFEDGTTDHAVELFISNGEIKQLDPKFIKDMYYETPEVATNLLNSDGTLKLYPWELDKAYALRVDGVDYRVDGFINCGYMSAIGQDIWYLGAATGTGGNTVTVVSWEEYPFSIYGPQSYITNGSESLTIEYADGTTDHTIEIIEKEKKINQIAPKYIKDMYYEETSASIKGLNYKIIVFDGSSYEQTHNANIPLALGQKWNIIRTYDGGTLYENVEVRQAEDGTFYLGTPGASSEYPFYITANESIVNSMWRNNGFQQTNAINVVGASGSYDTSIIHHIDEKYLPILEEVYETVFEAEEINTDTETYVGTFDRLVGKYRVTYDGESNIVEFIDVPTEGFSFYYEENYGIETFEGNIYFGCLDDETHSLRIEKIQNVVKSEYLPNEAKAQPNWDQNDENASDYIKNRPFYKTDGTYIGMGQFVATSATELKHTTAAGDEFYEVVIPYLNTISGKGEICNIKIGENSGKISCSFDRGWFSISGMLSGNMLPWRTGEVWTLNINNGSVAFLEGSTYDIEFFDTLDPYKKMDPGYLPDIVYTSENAPVKFGDGQFSTVQGVYTIASEHATHAEGTGSNAGGPHAHAEGYYTLADSFASHAEGRETMATGYGSHAEGWGTMATGDSSHAAGNYTVANQYGMYVFGDFNQVFDDMWFEVVNPITQTLSSTVEFYCSDEYTFDTSTGIFTLVNPKLQTGVSIGKYCVSSSLNIDNLTSITKVISKAGVNKYNTLDYTRRSKRTNRGDYVHIVGNGVSENTRSNAHTLDWSGNAWYSGDVYVGSTSGTNKDEGSKKLATEEFVHSSSHPQMYLTDQTTGFQYTIAVDNGSLVSAPRPFTYTITTVPTTTTYTAGEYFDATGLATAVVYDDDSRVEITDYHFPAEYLAEGTTEVTITATILGSEYSVTTDVTVTALDPATYLADYTYTDNGDGTYTVTGWADTTKTDELTIPNNYFVKMGG